MMIVRKRRTREHVIADLAVNHVERQVLLCGYTAERIAYDYGYDLSVYTFGADGEAESGEIRVQVKATDDLATLRDGMSIPWRVDRSDVALWIDDNAPVILIVYDARAELAYWLYVQRYFAEIEQFNIFSAPKSMTIHLSTRNALDRDAVEWIANRKRHIVGLRSGGNLHQ